MRKNFYGCYLLLCLGVLMASPALCVAENGATDNYRYRIPVEAAKMGQFYRLPLPDSVYSHLGREDFNDIQLVDSQGLVPPFTLIPAQQEVRLQREDPIPFYPIYANRALDEEKVELILEKGGKRVTLNTRHSGTQQQKVVGYLLDLRALSDQPQQLRFYWEEGGKPFITPIRLSTGSNLADWTSLYSNSTLAELQHGGRSLQENSFPLPSGSRTEKYLLLTWGEGKDLPPLQKIIGSRFSSHPPTYALKRVSATRSAQGEKGEFIYDLGGIYPLRSVNLLVQDSFFSEVTLLSASSDRGEWRAPRTSDFYRLSVGGQALVNRPLSVSGENKRFWRASFGEKSFPATPPELEVEWAPMELLFFTQGTAPFYLRFGGDLPAEQNPGESLFSLLDTPKESLPLATTGAIEKRGGAVDASSAPVAWGKGVLLFLLCAAVALLSFMAWKLSKSMGNRPK